MIDFREYKTVPKTFELEQTIADNDSYRSENSVLTGLTLVVAAGAVFLICYFITEQQRYDSQKNYGNNN